MCGIVGYIGTRNATPLIIDGLQRLEYRGYDSAGIAVTQNGSIALRRDVGKLSNLRSKLERDPLNGQIGIGHTRWATHGAPVEHNAHPHVSMNGDYVVVHNGIVENYLDLREQLTAEGVVFTSDTDTEVIVQLVARFSDDGAHGDITEATRLAVGCSERRARDCYHEQVPAGSTGGGARRQCGWGRARAGRGRKFHRLRHSRHPRPDAAHDLPRKPPDGDGQLPMTSSMQTLTQTPVEPQIHEIAWDVVSAAKGEYRHFMQKEIFEQGRSLTDTIRGRVDFEHETILLPELNLTAEQANSASADCHRRLRHQLLQRTRR